MDGANNSRPHGQRSIESKCQLQAWTPRALKVLVVDDEPNIRLTLCICLEARGHKVVAHGTIEQALEEVARQSFDVIFLDLRLGTQNGLDFIPELCSQNPWTRIVVITAHASLESADEAMKRGASDYLAKPFEVAQVRCVAEKRPYQKPTTKA